MHQGYFNIFLVSEAIRTEQGDHLLSKPLVLEARVTASQKGTLKGQ